MPLALGEQLRPPLVRARDNAVQLPLQAIVMPCRGMLRSPGLPDEITRRYPLERGIPGIRLPEPGEPQAAHR